MLCETTTESSCKRQMINPTRFSALRYPGTNGVVRRVLVNAEKVRSSLLELLPNYLQSSRVIKHPFYSLMNISAPIVSVRYESATRSRWRVRVRK